MQQSSFSSAIFKPRPVSFVIAAIIALNLLLLSDTVWLSAALFRAPSLPIAAAPQARGFSDSSSEAGYSVQSLLGVPLFGVAPVTPVAEAEVQQNVRTSALKIKVIGLVAGEGDEGVAILQYGGKTKVYGIGEKIEVPGSVKLLAVLTDHIIIENNRQQEKVELDKKEALKGVTTTSSSSTPVASASSDNINLNDSKFTDLIGDPRETLQNSPLKLVRFFAVSPVTEGDRLVGYSVKPGRDARLFEILDLQDGDVLLSVNGQALADMPPTELLKFMENTTSFELLVQRNGTILSKRLDL